MTRTTKTTKRRKASQKRDKGPTTWFNWITGSLNKRSREDNSDIFRRVPGQYVDDKSEEQERCAGRHYRDLPSYQRCEGSYKQYVHFVHKDDLVGVSCWKCQAAARRPKPISNKQTRFRRNPERILSKLSFACFPAIVSYYDFKKTNNSPLLTRGKILLVKRYNNVGKTPLTVEEYAEIPITEEGSVREIELSVCQYYHLRFQQDQPVTGFGNLKVRGIYKVDETYYRCNLEY